MYVRPEPEDCVVVVANRTPPQLACSLILPFVSNEQAKQLKDYENAVMQKRLEELDEDEVQALMEEVDRDEF